MSSTEMQRLLTGRDRAILAAVAAGRAELSCSCEPDLFIDGLCCCDQASAHRLFHDGLIAPASPGQPNARGVAVLTPLGLAAVASAGFGTAECHRQISVTANFPTDQQVSP